MAMVAKLRGLSHDEVNRIGADPSYLQTALATPTPDTLELPRSWHALHFLLCRDPWDGPEPLKHAILGGVELGDDLGHGAARVLGPDLVRRVAHAIAPIEPAVVVEQHYQPAQLEAADIYPGGWEYTGGWPPTLASDLARLRDFYERRAQSGDAVLISIA